MIVLSVPLKLPPKPAPLGTPELPGGASCGGGGKVRAPNRSFWPRQLLYTTTQYKTLGLPVRPQHLLGATVG